jgi:hypothetical protein
MKSLLLSRGSQFARKAITMSKRGTVIAREIASLEKAIAKSKNAKFRENAMAAVLGLKKMNNLLNKMELNLGNIS